MALLKPGANNSLWPYICAADHHPCPQAAAATCTAIQSASQPISTPLSPFTLWTIDFSYSQNVNFSEVTEIELSFQGLKGAPWPFRASRACTCLPRHWFACCMCPCLLWCPVA